MSHTVPSTSKDAYESIKGEMQQNHYTKILSALELVECAIYEDIASLTGMERHQVGRRLSELEGQNKVYRTGIKKPTSTGRLAYCYSLIGTGLPAAEEKSKKVSKPKTVPKAPNPDKKVIPVVAHTRTLKKETPPSLIKQERLF